MINLLNVSKLAEKIGDRPVMHELLLETVHKLCVEAAARLEDYYGDYRVNLYAADFKDSKYYDLVGVCEDTRLSIAAIGIPFVAYVLDSNKMPTLTNPQLQIWLDTLASFCVVDEPNCIEKPEMRKEYYAMQNAVEQLAIRDRVCNGDLANWAV